MRNVMMKYDEIMRIYIVLSYYDILQYMLAIRILDTIYSLVIAASRIQ